MIQSYSATPSREKVNTSDLLLTSQSVPHKSASWCFPADSENATVTLSALLASLNSCCNPWIYMIFSGHLLSDFARSLPCCRRLRNKFGHQDSDSSIRRTTLLSRLQGPRLSEPFRDLNTTPKNCPSASWPPETPSVCVCVCVAKTTLKTWTGLYLLVFAVKEGMISSEEGAVTPTVCFLWSDPEWKSLLCGNF